MPLISSVIVVVSIVTLALFRRPVTAVLAALRRHALGATTVGTTS